MAQFQPRTTDNGHPLPTAFCLLLSACFLLMARPLSAAPVPQRAQKAEPAANQRTASKAEASAANESYEQLTPQAMETTRSTFNEILDRFPRLAGVAARDPSLLNNEDYVRSTAPELWQFLQQHPEVARDPEFFLEGRMRRVGLYDRGERDSDLLRFLGDLLPFLVFVIMVIAVLWVVRAIIENRRWSRLAKIQTEAHTKLLEKFGSSQELLAYMATEPGKRFLEAAAPVPTDFEPRPRISAPIGRIMWSVQVGLILMLAGIGLLYIRASVPDGEQAMLVLGTLGLTFGLGFVLSAAISYVLSKHLGLLERAGPTLSDVEMGGSRQ